MPSRKRNKGRARKAAAKSSANDKTAGQQAANAGAAQAEPTAISRQVPRARKTTNSEPRQLMGGLSQAETRCNHGFPALTDEDRIFTSFVTVFQEMLERTIDSFPTTPSPNSLYPQLVMNLCHDRRINFGGIWHKTAYSKKLIAVLVSLGTNYLLQNRGPRDTTLAGALAMAVFFNDHEESGPADIGSLGKLRDLAEGGNRTIVRYFAKRTPCNCLAERYEASKKESKVAICANCNETMERSKLLLCGSCKLVHYDCQKQDWQRHKFPCKLVQKGADAVASALLSSTTNP